MMAFQIYQFDRIYGKVIENTATKETQQCFFLVPDRWYPKGQRVLKITQDGIWHDNRGRAVKDGIDYLTRHIDSLQDRLSKAQSQLTELSKETQ